MPNFTSNFTAKRLIVIFQTFSRPSSSNIAPRIRPPPLCKKNETGFLQRVTCLILLQPFLSRGNSVIDRELLYRSSFAKRTVPDGSAPPSLPTGSESVFQSGSPRSAGTSPDPRRLCNCQEDCENFSYIKKKPAGSRQGKKHYTHF